VIEAAVLETSADDYEITGDEITVYTQPKETMAVAQSLMGAGLVVADIELHMEPKATILIEDASIARTLIALSTLLEDLDDVTAVSANFDIAPELEVG
jgi:transcriptional/translational regulatory protein YebC/TACO1